MPNLRSTFCRIVAVNCALVAALATGSASATVIHYGPNEPYRPIYDAADLVVNGNFNADPLVDPANEFAANPNVTGWVISPPSQFPGTRNSNAGWAPTAAGCGSET